MKSKLEIKRKIKDKLERTGYSKRDFKIYKNYFGDWVIALNFVDYGLKRRFEGLGILQVDVDNHKTYAIIKNLNMFLRR